MKNTKILSFLQEHFTVKTDTVRNYYQTLNFETFNKEYKYVGWRSRDELEKKEKRTRHATHTRDTAVEVGACS